MAIAYEAIGAGVIDYDAGGTNSGTISHSHPGADGPDGIVVALVGGFRSLSQTVSHNTVTYGGNNMTALTQVWGNNVDPEAVSDSGWFQFFYLLDPPSGSQTVQYSYSMATAPLTLDLCANTISFTGVDSVGSLSSIGGTETGTALSMTYNSAAGRVVVQAFMQEWSTTINDYSQTQRFAIDSGGSYNAMLGTAPGGATVGFTATRTSGADYAGMAFDLIPSGAGGANTAGNFFQFL